VYSVTPESTLTYTIQKLMASKFLSGVSISHTDAVDSSKLPSAVRDRLIPRAGFTFVCLTRQPLRRRIYR
jgi:hypothetical protein